MLYYIYIAVHIILYYTIHYWRFDQLCISTLKARTRQVRIHESGGVSTLTFWAIREEMSFQHSLSDMPGEVYQVRRRHFGKVHVFQEFQDLGWVQGSSFDSHAHTQTLAHRQVRLHEVEFGVLGFLVQVYGLDSSRHPGFQDFGTNIEAFSIHAHSSTSRHLVFIHSDVAPSVLQVFRIALLDKRSSILCFIP